MIKTDELRGIIAKNGLSQSDVALKNWSLRRKPFYEKNEKWCLLEVMKFRL